MIWVAIGLGICALNWVAGRAHSRHLDRMQRAQRIAFGAINQRNARKRKRDFIPLLIAVLVVSIAVAPHWG
jgi:hypothetical protein